ncbi:MAG: hypothetical protein U1F30_01225 [Steroidobacteraceae bacterium]
MPLPLQGPADRAALLAGLATLCRGTRAAAPGAVAAPSGLAALDAVLPEGGWPRGALTELLADTPGIGELALLLPALAGLDRAGLAQAWIAPPHLPCAAGLAQGGIDLGRLLLVATRDERETLWAAEQALRCTGLGAVLLWPAAPADRSAAPPAARGRERRIARLPLPAGRRRGHAFARGAAPAARAAGRRTRGPHHQGPWRASACCGCASSCRGWRMRRWPAPTRRHRAARRPGGPRSSASRPGRCGGAATCPCAETGGGPGLWLELGASRTLFGGLEPLLARLHAALEPLGYSTRCGVAPTSAGAALLARAGEPAPVTTLAGLRARLGPLPPGLLALPEATLAACDSAGIRSIGTLLGMPDEAIARRFGPAASRYLQQLTGRMPAPLPAWRPPERWHARCEFPLPVEATTALLFPLQRLLHEFAGYLCAADRAVQRFELVLERRGHAPLRLPIGLSVPGRDAAQFLRLARERLAGAPPGAAVSALVLAADAFTAPVTRQADFLAPERNAASDLQQLLDRLGARLGDGAVRRLATHPDHRPERAWRYRPAGGTGADDPPAIAAMAAHAADGAAPDAAPPRPCWLLREPRPIAPPPQLLAGPERIEGGWWDGGDVARDYYLARAAGGSRLWVFRELRSGGWYLAGLWS